MIRIIASLPLPPCEGEHSEKTAVNEETSCKNEVFGDCNTSTGASCGERRMASEDKVEVGHFLVA